MGYSVDPIADGCYDGTSVLVNKFDIRDGEKLAEVEAVVSSMRNAEWLNAPQANTLILSITRRFIGICSLTCTNGQE